MLLLKQSLCLMSLPRWITLALHFNRVVKVEQLFCTVHENEQNSVVNHKKIFLDYKLPGL